MVLKSVEKTSPSIATEDISSLSERMGLIHCGHEESGYLLAPDGARPSDCSEETSRLVDEEVKTILDDCYGQARRLLVEHRAGLDAVASELLEKETLDAATFKRILAGVRSEVGPAGEGPGENAGSPPATPSEGQEGPEVSARPRLDRG